MITGIGWHTEWTRARFARAPYRANRKLVALKRRDDGFYDRYAIKTPRLQLVWKKRRRECGVYPTATRNGPSRRQRSEVPGTLIRRIAGRNGNR
jgi:hypothetical protein